MAFTTKASQDAFGLSILSGSISYFHRSVEAIFNNRVVPAVLTTKRCEINGSAFRISSQNKSEVRSCAWHECCVVPLQCDRHLSWTPRHHPCLVNHDLFNNLVLFCQIAFFATSASSVGVGRIIAFQVAEGTATIRCIDLITFSDDRLHLPHVSRTATADRTVQVAVHLLVAPARLLPLFTSSQLDVDASVELAVPFSSLKFTWGD